MTDQMPRLGTDEVWNAFEDIDPVAVIVDELTGKPWDASAFCRLTPGAEGEDLAVLEDARSGVRCLLPASMLRTFRAASLATVAARELLAPGVAIVGILGSDLAAQVHVGTLARYLPDISHVAVCAAPDQPSVLIEPRLLDRLDLSGIGLTVTADVREAVLGANLIVVPAGGRDARSVGRPTAGALLVNGSGRDLASDIVDRVDKIYIDDPTLLGRNAHRYFVLAQRPGWSRHRGNQVRVADLRQLLATGVRGRRNADDILLAELLSAHRLDARLAWEVHRAATARDPGHV
jgi:ornithine cyclodeaminase/alanine dehydrogenase-like protein (mu-crystallin family)